MPALLALVSGALTPLALAPFDWWLLGLVAMAGLALSLRDASVKQAAWRGWLFGSAAFATGVSWVFVAMHSFGNTSVALSVLMTGFFCLGLGTIPALFASCYVRWLRGAKGVNVIGFAAGWTLFEWLRSWVLTGFPWLYLGYGHLDSPLAGWAPITGIFGLNFWVAFAGAALALVPAHGPTICQRIQIRTAAPAIAAAAALLALGASLRSYEWTDLKARPSMTIGAIQANITQDKKWAYEQYWATLELYDRATEAMWHDVDVVIWPEAAVPALYHHARPFFDYLRERAEANNTALISGVPTRFDEAMYNSVMVVSGGEGIYHKQRLVPFGEYVPLSRYLRGLIPFFDLPLSSFSRGSPDQSPLQVADWRLAPSICYEIVYPDLVARGAKDVDLLFTISNDAWFGQSFGPAQHMQMAQMRALENGRELVRVTGTGITAIVDHRGRIRSRLPAHQRGDLIGEVHARQGQTPFNRFGSTPILILCGLLCLAAAVRARQQ